MKFMMSGRPLAAAVAVCAGLTVPAMATGPKEQTLPWFAPNTHPFNSVVDIYVKDRVSPQDEGTGSIIGRKTITKPDGTKEGWLCVLTAAHVVDEGGPFRISFGDQASGPGHPGLVGGANKSWGAVHTQTDLGIIAVNYGTPDFFFDNLFLHTMTPVTAQGLVTDKKQFTEAGYGFTGQFAAGGLRRDAVDSFETKRFQNNEINGKENTTVRGRTFEAVTWTFDAPAATGFLAAEGCSFPGDSGGPYFGDSTSDVLTFTPAMTRPGETDWPGGFMSIYSKGIIAVHSDAQPTTAAGAIRAYGTKGYGVPMTQANIDWVTGFCAAIPSPSTGVSLGFGFLFAARRRRN